MQWCYKKKIHWSYNKYNCLSQIKNKGKMTRSYFFSHIITSIFLHKYTSLYWYEFGVTRLLDKQDFFSWPHHFRYITYFESEFFERKNFIKLPNLIFSIQNQGNNWNSMKFLNYVNKYVFPFQEITWIKDERRSGEFFRRY